MHVHSQENSCLTCTFLSCASVAACCHYMLTFPPLSMKNLVPPQKL